MAFKYIFSRYEYKYMVNIAQKQAVIDAMQGYTKPDRYGKSIVRNIYFDTPNYLLIRRSIEKPIYKEKLRLRSYARAEDNSTVFVELKKKYKGVVYKRRISMGYKEALDWICRRKYPKETGQIHRETDYFLDYYGKIIPAAVIFYEREAFFGVEDDSLRITFDENLLARTEDVALDSEVYGDPLLDKGLSIMEIKCSGGMPLWLTDTLAKNKIYKASFSKYGTAYRNMIYPKLYRRDGKKNG